LPIGEIDNIAFALLRRSTQEGYVPDHDDEGCWRLNDAGEKILFFQELASLFQEEPILFKFRKLLIYSQVVPEQDAPVFTIFSSLNVTVGRPIFFREDQIAWVPETLEHLSASLFVIKIADPAFTDKIDIFANLSFSAYYFAFGDCFAFQIMTKTLFKGSRHRLDPIQEVDRKFHRQSKV
jgi:hypothetical protein